MRESGVCACEIRDRGERKIQKIVVVSFLTVYLGVQKLYSRIKKRKNVSNATLMLSGATKGHTVYTSFTTVVFFIPYHEC